MTEKARRALDAVEEVFAERTRDLSTAEYRDVVEELADALDVRIQTLDTEEDRLASGFPAEAEYQGEPDAD